MFGTLGGPELFLIFVVALIVFGPRKLPDIGKSLGRMMGEFRRASNEFKSTIESEVESEKIKESMRIEAPRVKPVKAKSPSAAATAAGVAAADGGASSPETARPNDSEAAGPSDVDSERPATAADGVESGPVADSASGGEEPSSDAASEAAPAGETVPETVSRQPSGPAPAEEPK